MRTVGIFEAKTHLSSLLEEVEGGESILVTKRGEAIAQIIPIRDSKRSSAEAVLARFEERAKKVKEMFPEPDTMTVREMIDLGRK